VDPSIHPPVSVGAVIFSRDIFLASIYSAEADSFTAPASAPRLRVALCGCVDYGSCSLPALSRRHQLSVASSSFYFSTGVLRSDFGLLRA
jgi:hypothetical protein